MNEGYVLYGGNEYYCSEECLRTEYNEEEWISIYSENEDSYYTEWEDEDDYQYVEVNGKIIEL
jgi:hypothetical protein